MLLNPLRKKIQASTCSGPQDVVQENQIDYLVEHKTCDILAAERLRLMRFDNRLIIDSFQEDIW